MDGSIGGIGGGHLGWGMRISAHGLEGLCTELGGVTDPCYPGTTTALRLDACRTYEPARKFRSLADKELWHEAW